MQNKKIVITVANQDLEQEGLQLSHHLNLPFVPTGSQEYQYSLVITHRQIELHINHPKGLKPLLIDFLSKEMQFRRQHIQIRHELLARAVGLLRQKNIVLLDLTAGLGTDAFLLACLGCQVTMLERSPILGVLLKDALQRAYQIDWVKKLSLEFVQCDARDYLTTLSAPNYPEVIYLDPMFPEKNKSAKSRKEMHVLRDVVGEDLDAAELLPLSLKKATKRVVVKRPRLAPPLAGQAPDVVYQGESSRFDVYLMS